uniref:Pectinesterase n=1 Tax=Anthurium amnicola TaxID=1678845 RepID=A0A1D1XN60_9ARAE
MASSLFHPPSPRLLFLSVLLLLLLSLPPPSLSTAVPGGNPSSSSSDPHLSSVKALCSSTPYPDACFQSLKLSIGVGVGVGVGPLPLLFQSLQSAIADALKLSALLASANLGIAEKQRGTIQDCRELHEITLSSLRRSASLVQSGRRLRDVRTYLSAALTNRATCLEGLATASGPSKAALAGAVADAYKSVTNSLSVLSQLAPVPPAGRGRRLLGASTGGGGEFPSWVSRRDRRLLLQATSEDDDNGYDPSSVLTVAADGSGNFTTVGDAVEFAPSGSGDRTIIIVRAGVYEENVVVPSEKSNLVFLGDGSDVTVIRGSRSVGDGWTTFRSATVAISGEGFLARDIAFENTAGPGKGQAVALRVNADLAAFYLCAMAGYQDTLYPHSFRQFYRACSVSGTVDFVFGNAAASFQACTILPRKPLPGQFNAITAQSRDDPNMNTGFSVQNCTVVASEELANTRTYLGRPWKPYSRTVYMGSYLGELVHPAGWAEWDGDRGLDTLYYGEYGNRGPGAATDKRVAWPGYHVMAYDDAVRFTVSQLIDGDQWLDSTSFPYDDGV